MRSFIVALVLFFSAQATAGPSADLQLAPEERLCETSPESVVAALGIGDVTLFVEGRSGEGLCLSSALSLASRALLSARGDESPGSVARDSALPLTSWFDRATAAIAGPIGPDATWPRPPSQLADERGWIFFATSPDLSDHWYWLVVDEPNDGQARVRLWTER